MFRRSYSMYATYQTSCCTQGTVISSHESLYILITCQLLEAIGVISKQDGERGAASGGNYQDDIIAYAGEDEMEALNEDEDDDKSIIEAVSKVSCCRTQ